MVDAGPLVIIGNRPVGPGQPCLVIAEVGVNHNGDLELARRLVREAAHAGADAVKFQAFSAQRLASASAPMAAYQVANTGADEGQLAMLSRLELGPEQLALLIRECDRAGVLFMCSAFDEQDIEVLERLDVRAFKIPSGEASNPRYLERVARSGRPVLLSTGMCTLAEVEAAVETLRSAGDPPVVILHCVSLYPTPPRLANLAAMATLREHFEVPVGYSDHTLGPNVAIAAAALGAAVLEKHLTLDRKLPGPDHAASLEPGEFRAMVEAVREVEQAAGDGLKTPSAEEEVTARAARKSVVAALDIPAGTLIEPAMLTLKRPGTGIPARDFDAVVGRVAVHFIAADTLIDRDQIR